MKRILIVDDEPEILEGVRLLLEPRYAVLVASDGEKALRLLDAQPVDLVLLDMAMPLMDGEGVLRILRSRGSAPPVIILSAHGRLEERARSLGATAWVSKPFDPRTLEARIEEILGS